MEGVLDPTSDPTLIEISCVNITTLHSSTTVSGLVPGMAGVLDPTSDSTLVGVCLVKPTSVQISIHKEGDPLKYHAAPKFFDFFETRCFFGVEGRNGPWREKSNTMISQ